ncbi:MAG: hypothetical protein WC450_10820, partial [Candidatus Omnitrophota bacterium]
EGSKNDQRNTPIWNDMTGFADQVRLLQYYYNSDGDGKDAYLWASQDDDGVVGFYEVKENNDNLADKIKRKYIVESSASGISTSQKEEPANTVIPGRI